MKRAVSFNIWVAIIMVVLLSCDKINNGSDPDNPDNPNIVMQDVALSGTVKDTNGNPLSGVQVTTGSSNVTTGSDGAFSFAQAGTVNDRVIMKYEKSGYFTLTRSCDKDSALYVEAMLYPQGNSDISLQITFDASTAKTLQVAGMTIDFPASSVVTADGKAYSGTVHVNALYLAPDNANFASMMPGGDLTCQLSNNDEQMLQPYGMTDVMLTDDAGNQLEIKADAGVQISFPLPAALTTNAPPTLTFWTFNEARGVWTEEGTLTLQGNAYKGEVKHFTKHAAGKSGKKTTVKVRVLTCGKTKAGAHVWIQDGWEDNLYSSYTNSSGYCSIPFNSLLPRMTDNVVIFAKSDGQTQSIIIPTKSITGSQIVQFNFDCKGKVITLNLKPGPDSQSFYIECSPAMPMDYDCNFGVSGGPGTCADNPASFLGGYNPACECDDGPFVYTDDSGSFSDVDLIDSECYNCGIPYGWNAGQTLYRYNFYELQSKVGDTEDWTFTVKMQQFLMDGRPRTFHESYDPEIVDTVKIGSNSPVSIRIPHN